MAAEPQNSEQLGIRLDRLTIECEDTSSKSGDDMEPSKFDDNFIAKWGFPLRELYQLALRFYRDKEGKAMNLSYADKVSLLALAKQANCGKYDPLTSPAIGVLDVIGRDRRLAWQALGDMTREQAMINFIESLDMKCSLFRPFIEAHKADIEFKKRRQAEIEGTRQEEEARRQLQEMRRRQVQQALNQQTYPQFKLYIQQQYPDDPAKQEELLLQLQEQHYQQYVEQIISLMKQEEGDEKQVVPNGCLPQRISPTSDDEMSGGHIITEASMWTRKNVKEFKDSIKKEGGDSIIKVRHGETLTVRFPTNNDGTCLSWEFATDHYDIGFGVLFEWTKSETNQVSVHISESEDDDDYLNDEYDDDDEDYDDDEVSESGRWDTEKGGPPRGRNQAPLSVIIPVCKRPCHSVVFAGSHTYPGHGVYLLKFDNSYSLLRSKTLYYRVYYTRSVLQ